MNKKIKVRVRTANIRIKNRRTTMNSYSKNKNDNSLRIENSSKDYESVQKDNETTIDPVISTNKDFINENTQDTNLIEKNEIDATSRVHHNATKVEK
jgi:hypothetical protein